MSREWTAILGTLGLMGLRKAILSEIKKRPRMSAMAAMTHVHHVAVDPDHPNF
jgi:hypothetical protein